MLPWLRYLTDMCSNFPASKHFYPLDHSSHLTRQDFSFLLQHHSWIGMSSADWKRMGLLLVSFGGLVHEWESASCVSISLSGVFVLGLMTGGAGRSCMCGCLSFRCCCYSNGSGIGDWGSWFMIGGQCGHLPFNGSCMQMILEVASKRTYCPRSPNSGSQPIHKPNS